MNTSNALALFALSAHSEMDVFFRDLGPMRSGYDKRVSQKKRRKLARRLNPHGW